MLRMIGLRPFLQIVAAVSTLTLTSLIVQSVLRPLGVTAKVRNTQLDDVEKELTYEVVFSNPLKTPVKIIGSQRSCTCISPGELPKTIPAGGLVVVEVTAGVEVDLTEITYFLSGATHSRLRVALR
ncbi:MAG: hypothetical protein Aurels2KO_50930 [Aureliella sp.]